MDLFPESRLAFLFNGQSFEGNLTSFKNQYPYPHHILSIVARIKLIMP